MVSTYKPRPSSFLPPAPILPHVIAESVAREILSGKVKPSTVISAGSIADNLGVTRSTAQSALAILHTKGLVTTRFRHGTTVNHWDRWHLLDPDVLKWAPADGWLARSASNLYRVLAAADDHTDQPDPIMLHLAQILQRFAEEKV